MAKKNGTTTSALLWVYVRNVCTFSAVTLYRYLVSVYLFTSLYHFYLVLFLIFESVTQAKGCGWEWFLETVDLCPLPFAWVAMYCQSLPLSFILYKNTHIYLCICNQIGRAHV